MSTLLCYSLNTLLTVDSSNKQSGSQSLVTCMLPVVLLNLEVSLHPDGNFCCHAEGFQFDVVTSFCCCALGSHPSRCRRCACHACDHSRFGQVATSHGFHSFEHGASFHSAAGLSVPPPTGLTMLVRINTLSTHVYPAGTHAKIPLWLICPVPTVLELSGKCCPFHMVAVGMVISFF